jgi:glucose-1-phosphate thymidylyltransferase
MKGLVLAGGKGSRLRPFTYSGAKQLVPIANIPVLHFPVRQLVDAGIPEIGIVVGDNEPQIREAMGDGSQFGAAFTYIRQPAPLGLAHAIATARPFLGDTPFVLYLGDNVLVGGIGAFVEEFRAYGTAGVILKEVDDPRAFGVAVVADGRIQRVIEKPLKPPTNLAVIGVYALVPAVFDIIAAQVPSARGELEIADTLNGLVARGHDVRATLTPEYWIDTGKMEDMLAANRVILATLPPKQERAVTLERTTIAGMAAIDSGAHIEDCEVVGPVAIGAGARLARSRIGPYAAIGARAVIEDSSIRDTIVMEEAAVSACHGIEHSMIGRFAVVRGVPPGTRLTLGDHSRVEGSA